MRASSSASGKAMPTRSVERVPRGNTQDDGSSGPGIHRLDVPSEDGVPGS
jgi:hypothetical protein